MATLHGYPVMLAGSRLAVVEMPDCWAIMNTLDTFPQATFRFSKDETGWREAVAQLHRSDTHERPRRRSASTVRTGVTRDRQRLLTAPRIGVATSSAILGIAAVLPWAVATVTLGTGGTVQPVPQHFTLFDVLDAGWRRPMPWVLVAVAAVGVVVAAVARHERIHLYALGLGVVATVPIITGLMRVNDFTDVRVLSGGFRLGVTMSYGVLVAAAGCLLLVFSWAVFPGPRRRRRPAEPPAGPRMLATGGFPGAGTIGGFGVDRGVGAEAFAAGGSPSVGHARFEPPGPAPAPAGAPTVDLDPGRPIHVNGLPPLGAALAQIARQSVAAPQAPHDPQGGPAIQVLPPVPTSLAGTQSPPPPPPVRTVQPPSPPAGWYPDHARPGTQRYWDGDQWTRHTHPPSAGR